MEYLHNKKKAHYNMEMRQDIFGQSGSVTYENLTNVTKGDFHDIISVFSAGNVLLNSLQL